MYRLLLVLCFSSDVRDLGADDFVVRETAEARLTSWSELSFHALDRPFRDPEVRRRAARVRAKVLPDHYPPLSVLGAPLLEWSTVGPDGIRSCVSTCPGPGWELSWFRPDPSHRLYPLVRFYGERARTQHTWRDWHSYHDSCEATRLLTRDLVYAGVPSLFVHAGLRRLSAVEASFRRLPPAPPIPQSAYR